MFIDVLECKYSTPGLGTEGESSKGFLLFFMPFFVDIGNDGIFVSYFLTE